MNEPVNPDTAPPAPAGDPADGREDPAGLNPLQRAVAERAMAQSGRRSWLPRMSRTQWIVSVGITIVTVFLVIRAVDAGLTALHLFMEAVSNTAEQNAAAEAAAREAAAREAEANRPAPDVSDPMPIVVLPQMTELPPAPADPEP